MRLTAGCTSSWKWSEALKSRLNHVTSIPENNELRYFLLYLPNVAEGKFPELRLQGVLGSSVPEKWRPTTRMK
jgi:hypothetical protein